MMVLSFILVQLIVASVVLFVLKCMLDRELEQAAVEQLMALKASDAVTGVMVYHGASLSSQLKDRLTTIIRAKFARAQVVFEHVGSLKGGLMIKVADEVLDFSVSSRLEHLWS